LNYTLVYTKRAVKDIKKLDTQVKQRIKEGLEKYSKYPFRYADVLTLSNLGGYRFRIGDYRIIFDIEEDKIIILRIGHRSKIYRSM